MRLRVVNPTLPIAVSTRIQRLWTSDFLDTTTSVVISVKLYLSAIKVSSDTIAATAATATATAATAAAAADGGR
jgi:hypothetical protein